MAKESLTNQDREPSEDMRFPGEKFCSDCPDREACSTAHPCDYVRRVNHERA